MNNRVNYSLVGFLVLLALSMMMVFGYWLLKPTDDLEMQKYVIHFDESVLGLNLDAPVKYRGINVGKVVKLRINPDNSEQVEVLIDVFKTTPIKSSTVAKLTAQGITGLSYINLTLGDSGAPALKAKKGDKYPIIKTVPSLFTRLEKSFGSVSENLSQTLVKTQELLNENNQAEVTSLLKNGAEFMVRMNKILDNDTIEHFQSSMKNINETTKKLDHMMPKIDKFIANTVSWEDKISLSFKSITGSYHGIKTTMDLFKESLARGDFNIKDISNEVIPSINNTLFEMQKLMIKMQEVMDQYERNPGGMIFTQEKIKKGPGED